MRVSKIEKILIGIFFLAVWIMLASFAGAPIFSDEFLYIDAGLRRFAEPSYGNRYFHVYLQKLFMDLAPAPLAGIRVFWGFLIALTAAQIYLHARTLTKKSSPLHGLLALAFFFSFPLITEYSGEPAVDITAMAMVTLYISLYLVALKAKAKKELALTALGALVFLCFKTKETTIFVNLLLLGFAFDDRGRWQWRELLRVIRPLLTGFAIGIGLFILLDGLILGKPFFAISPATFGAVFKNYDFQPGFFFGPSSWYREYFLDELTLPFLLFVLSGLSLRGKISPRYRLLWIFPLALAVFVTLNMLKVTFGFIERFYFPALPLIAALAPQVLDIRWPKTRRQWLAFALLALASAALMLWLRSYMMAAAASLNFDFGRFLDSLYYPALLSILLGALIWSRRFHWAASIIPLFCIAAMLLSPLTYSYKYFFRFPKVQERYDKLMAPFEEFRDELDVQGADILLVSAGLDRQLEMLSDDPNDIIGMYNFFFDRRINEENVLMGYTRASAGKFLAEKNIAFTLLTAEDWQVLSCDAEIKSAYNARLSSPDGEFVLLTGK